tara:strand:+ start:7576 stop:7782 length:207 start_codon:yes stop_codon:yes gene_type:complete
MSDFENTANENNDLIVNLSKQKELLENENKKYVESLHKYESISYNYAILNIIGVITLISAYKYISNIK